MARDLIEGRRAAKALGGRAVMQAAALGYVEDEDGLRYLIVTSRRTRRWIFPKGNVNADESAPAAAARELAEEAGAVGEAWAEPVGIYKSLKLTDKGLMPLEIALYPVCVSELRSTWPDIAKRERRLVPVEEARQLLATPEMAELLVQFHDSLAGPES